MLHQNRCDSEISGPAKDRGKSIGLSGAQWSGIIKHLHRGEPEAQQSEQARQYEEYLRTGSRAMTKSWENTFEKQREAKAAAKEREELAKVKEGENRFRTLKLNDEKKRMDQIAIAQSMIDRVKIGPRQLDSAYLLADVLGTRQVQRAMNANTAAATRERMMAEGKQSIAQAEQGVAEYREKIQTKKRLDDCFKQQAFQQFQVENVRRQQEAKKTALQERHHRNAEENELRNQMEMERVILMRKKEMQRKNALEAMQMAEQRRHRMITVNDLEDKLVSIAANTGTIIKDTRKRNDLVVADEKDRLRSTFMAKVYGAQLEKVRDEKVYYNSVAELEQKFVVQEKAKQENNKRLKIARIQAHLVESETAKRAQQQQLEERQWDMANRFRNQEVNALYEKQCREEKLAKQREYNASIQRQMQENQVADVQSAAANVFTAENAKDDEHFFGYAKELIDETAGKKRPILPLLRVVEEYKKTNGLIQYDRDQLIALKTSAGVVKPNGLPEHLQWRIPHWRGKQGFEKC